MTLSQSQGRIGSSSCFMPCLSPDECGRWQRLVVRTSASPCPVRLLTRRCYGNVRAEEIGKLVMSRPPGRDDGASTFPHWTCADKPDMDPTQEHGSQSNGSRPGADGKCQVV